MCLALLAGCLPIGLPGPRPPAPGAGPPAPVRPPLAGIGEHYRSAWEGLPTGSEPAEFADVAVEQAPAVWLYSGNWAIARDGDQAVYAVAPYAGSYPEPLTFRRYRGQAFGPDGVLPNRYRIRAIGCSTGGSRRFDGVGELAMQVLYADPTHYVEILQTDTQTRIWWADGARPQSMAGWHALAAWPRPYEAGQWLEFGADVDRVARTITAWRDGHVLGSVALPEAMAGVRPRMCLRATGNGEEWRSLAIRQLPPSPGRLGERG